MPHSSACWCEFTAFIILLIKKSMARTAAGMTIQNKFFSTRLSTFCEISNFKFVPKKDRLSMDFSNLKIKISVREITKMKINVPSCPAKSLPGPASRVRPPHETVGGETRLRYWLDSWSALKTWISVTSPWWNIFCADWRTAKLAK